MYNYFEYQIRYFFKQQNLLWGLNDQQQCLFNIHLESSFPSWKSTKESTKKVSPTWWLLRMVPVRNTGWHSPRFSCLGMLMFMNYPVDWVKRWRGNIIFFLKGWLIFSGVFHCMSWTWPTGPVLNKVIQSIHARWRDPGLLLSFVCFVFISF